MHTAEIANTKMIRFKSPGTDQIYVKLIQAGGNTLRCEMHELLILPGIRKMCHRSGKKKILLYLFMERAVKLTAVMKDTNYIQDFIQYSV
jgi:hypothetical protein